jgi:hypothetical protein
LLAASLALSVDVQAQDVTVTMMDGSTASGSLETLTDTEVVLRGKLQPYPRMDVIPGTERIISLTNVHFIERRGHGIRNGVLIGIAAGVTSGLVLSETVDNTEYEDGMALALLSGIGAGIGLGIGAVFDAVRREGRLLYSAPAPGAVRVTALMTPARRGVQLTLAW